MNKLIRKSLIFSMLRIFASLNSGSECSEYDLKSEDLKSSPSELQDLKWHLHLWHLIRWINFDQFQWLNLILIQSYRTASIYCTSVFTRYPVLSCEQNKAIWLANVLMNYFKMSLRFRFRSTSLAVEGSECPLEVRSSSARHH
jgi:hypothetical protein